jgi:hypothetical protein
MRPGPERVLKLSNGPYDKGTLWKWGARGMGGALGWLVLLTLLGAFWTGVGFFVLAALMFVPMTAKAGLSGAPQSLEPATPLSVGGLMGWGFIIQDRIGDFMMTLFWNQVRTRTDTRFS